MMKKQVSKNKKSSVFLAVFVMAVFVMVFASVTSAQDTTAATIVSTDAKNNQLDVSPNGVITVRFSEKIDPTSVTKDTFLMRQRTTPREGSDESAYRSIPIEGRITADGKVITFTPVYPLFDADSKNEQVGYPNQINGNVYTMTLTTGIKDLAGNHLARDYVWSFSSGSNKFYTDNTTSELNQEPLFVFVPEVESESTPSTQESGNSSALVGTTSGKDNNAMSSFPWAWVIGLLLLLLLLTLVVLAYTTNNKKTVKTVTTTAVTTTEKKNGFGDVHPVSDLEGIGPHYKRRLNAIGIVNTYQLWKANKGMVAKKIGASPKLVTSWQNMAELCSVHDIGPQYAELLERSGIHSIDQLKKSNPDKVVALINKKQDSLDINIQGNHPGHDMVENWINEARAHKVST